MGSDPGSDPAERRWTIYVCEAEGCDLTESDQYACPRIGCPRKLKPGSYSKPVEVMEVPAGGLVAELEAERARADKAEKRLSVYQDARGQIKRDGTSRAALLVRAEQAEAALRRIYGLQHAYPDDPHEDRKLALNFSEAQGVAHDALAGDNSALIAERSAVSTATVTDARNVLLEDALRQAQNTVEFLHGCLTNPTYKYAYPEMTKDRLREWAELAPRTKSCFHSRPEEGCESCAARDRRFKQIAEARAVLAELPPRATSPKNVEERE